jgi:hypothetical protein
MSGLEGLGCQPNVKLAALAPCRNSPVARTRTVVNQALGRNFVKLWSL